VDLCYVRSFGVSRTGIFNQFFGGEIVGKIKKDVGDYGEYWVFWRYLGDERLINFKFLEFLMMKILKKNLEILFFLKEPFINDIT